MGGPQALDTQGRLFDFGSAKNSLPPLRMATIVGLG